ncbi:hypothetical protein Acr_00g0047330 [Actinidia rufa]|uniref:Uncharacterized protein n=1 Tax=Actinidia rufa TaxID=165716 RepID=A0A7J0DLL8_9ERIC|nr:hypothetical protein Acr_00g0047330 [Actinidia rufa]
MVSCHYVTSRFVSLFVLEIRLGSIVCVSGLIVEHCQIAVRLRNMRLLSADGAAMLFLVLPRCLILCPLLLFGSMGIVVLHGPNLEAFFSLSLDMSLEDFYGKYHVRCLVIFARPPSHMLFRPLPRALPCLHLCDLIILLGVILVVMAVVGVITPGVAIFLKVAAVILVVVAEVRVPCGVLIATRRIILLINV